MADQPKMKVRGRKRQYRRREGKRGYWWKDKQGDWHKFGGKGGGVVSHRNEFPDKDWKPPEPGTPEWDEMQKNTAQRENRISKQRMKTARRAANRPADLKGKRRSKPMRRLVGKTKAQREPNVAAYEAYTERKEAQKKAVSEINPEDYDTYDEYYAAVKKARQPLKRQEKHVLQHEYGKPWERKIFAKKGLRKFKEGRKELSSLREKEFGLSAEEKKLSTQLEGLATDDPDRKALSAKLKKLQTEKTTVGEQRTKAKEGIMKYREKKKGAIRRGYLHKKGGKTTTTPVTPATKTPSGRVPVGEGEGAKVVAQQKAGGRGRRKQLRRGRKYAGLQKAGELRAGREIPTGASTGQVKSAPLYKKAKKSGRKRGGRPRGRGYSRR